MKGHEVVARTLSASGVDVLFGLMGDANMLHIADFLALGGTRFIGAVHEAGATGMADAYSRVTGRPGVVTVTHGPGLTNTATAFVEAVRAQSPILVICGDTPPVPDHLQAADLRGFAGVVGAEYVEVLTADRIGVDIADAFLRVQITRRPILLNVPFALQMAAVSEDVRIPEVTSPVLSTAVDEDVLDEALGLLMNSRRPLVLGGRGVATPAAAKAVIDLADVVGAPLASTLLGKDAFRGHRLNIGVIGTLSTDLATETLATVDCVVSFGASLNTYTTAEGSILRDKRLIRCDANPAALARPPIANVSILGDVTATATAMTKRLSGFQVDVPERANAALEKALAEYDPRTEFVDSSGADTIDMRTAILELDALLPADRQVVTDAGRFVAAPWRYLHVGQLRGFMHTASFGSIGLGLGCAIGAAIGRPDVLTVAVIGDGGLMMSLGEFTTAVRQHIPLLVLCLNDGCYGAEYAKLVDYNRDPSLSFIPWPELADVAIAFGGAGMTVRSRADLATVADRARALDGPLLVDIKADPNVKIGQLY